MKITLNHLDKPIFDNLKVGDIFMLQFGDDDPMIYVKVSFFGPEPTAFNFSLNKLEKVDPSQRIIRVNAELVVTVE